MAADGALVDPLPCFSYYNDLDNLDFKDLQMKKDFKHTIIHPFDYEDDDSPIEVCLKQCVVYKGVPHGLAIISFKHESQDWLSFEGVGVFTHGQLHNGPFACFRGDGYGY